MAVQYATSEQCRLRQTQVQDKNTLMPAMDCRGDNNARAECLLLLFYCAVLCCESGQHHSHPTCLAEHDLDSLDVDGAQVDAGLDSLEAALRSGFEQFNKVREDPNLDNLRKSERFDKIINQYDEKVIDFT